jgi:glycosyltransferase involved in cell wall biosynthesis
MPSNLLYYHLKPYLPWRLRMTLRRILARRRRVVVQDVWPINEAAGQPPNGWPGWPDGKKFALVLTHDVEGPAGLAKCRQLMRLEMELGFRSSFNFIPEGDYAVSRELREELVRNRFEVGVQDLKHDGMLFQSRGTFRDGTGQINRYLQEWGAVGFRSGFMFHNLEWMHDLNVEYSSCTFDTDPFEPQPDGVGTIFPFWVPRSQSAIRNRQSAIRSAFPSSPSDQPSSTASRSGYIELPYTLPQDSTLFLLLQESSPAIWMQKLNWIAACGGMALLNTHPDYMAFNGAAPKAVEYPLDFYRHLLRHIQSCYDGAYWNALPKDVAAYVADTRAKKSAQMASRNLLTAREPALHCEIAPAPLEPTLVSVYEPPALLRKRFTNHRAAVLLFSEFPSDPRPRRAAEALAREGMIVDVISLGGNENEPRKETLDGINIWRVPLRRRRGGKLAYVWQYSAFIAVSWALLGLRSISRRYHLVHVHNMPDVLVFGALIPKLLGAKVILDLHDPMPELMMTIFGLRPDSFAVRVLRWNEKWSTAMADLVLTVNEASKRLYSSRSCPPEKVRVIMNSPDEAVFAFRPAVAFGPGSRGHFAIMYHGSLLERNGFDIAVEALEQVRRSIPGATLVVCGASTPFSEQVMKSARTRGLQDAIHCLGRQDRRQIVKAIDQCDIGIIPNRRNLFTEMNTPTRIFEYLSRGKPVIAPRSRGIQDYFGEEDILFFELGNASDLAEKLQYAFFHPTETQAVIRRGQQVYLEHKWSQEKAALVDSVGALLFGRSAAPPDSECSPASLKECNK